MENRKKILFLVTQSEFGGAQRFIYRLITSLNLNKYEIGVAAGPEGNNADGLLSRLQKYGLDRISLKFLKRGINPVLDFLGTIEIYGLFKKQKPDIVFLCSSKAGFLGGIVAGLLKMKKVIYRIGGWTFNDPWPKWKKNLYAWLEKHTAKFKDIIVNNAESDRSQAIKMGIRPKKEIVTIHNGLDVEKLEFLSKEEARRFLKLKPGFIVGTVANFYPAKGLKYLVEVADLLKGENIQFVLIGDGQERKNIENLIKNRGLDNILLAGGTPDAYRYLCAFDVFLLPSLKEGFPWTILEAMAAGVPVITTKVGAIPEIIEDKKNGILVEPKNPQAIADALKSLIKDKDLREKLSFEGKKRVAQSFNFKQMLEKYEDLFFID